MQWASSVYREGSHRIYLATRLLRKWSLPGSDIDDAILDFLRTMDTIGSEPRDAFRIVAELVRSRTFSVGKYLQWLIATGALSNAQHQEQVCLCSIIINVADLLFSSLIRRYGC
jgi:mediator of RNA polymerase II transcription subunit 12, fungi type